MRNAQMPLDKLITIFLVLIAAFIIAAGLMYLLKGAGERGLAGIFGW